MQINDIYLEKSDLILGKLRECSGLTGNLPRSLPVSVQCIFQIPRPLGKHLGYNMAS